MTLESLFAVLEVLVVFERLNNPLCVIALEAKNELAVRVAAKF